MSVELKNWKELCKEKDERIKELEGKFDLIVEKLYKLHGEKDRRKCESYEVKDWASFNLYADEKRGVYQAIKIVKGVINERD